jgi:hypothetical protein
MLGLQKTQKGAVKGQTLQGGGKTLLVVAYRPHKELEKHFQEGGEPRAWPEREPVFRPGGAAEEARFAETAGNKGGA